MSESTPKKKVTVHDTLVYSKSTKELVTEDEAYGANVVNNYSSYSAMKNEQAQRNLDEKKAYQLMAGSELERAQEEFDFFSNVEEPRRKKEFYDSLAVDKEHYQKTLDLALEKKDNADVAVMEARRLKRAAEKVRKDSLSRPNQHSQVSAASLAGTPAPSSNAAAASGQNFSQPGISANANGPMININVLLAAMQQGSLGDALSQLNPECASGIISALKQQTNVSDASSRHVDELDFPDCSDVTTPAQFQAILLQVLKLPGASPGKPLTKASELKRLLEDRKLYGPNAIINIIKDLDRVGYGSSVAWHSLVPKKMQEEDTMWAYFHGFKKLPLKLKVGHGSLDTDDLVVRLSLYADLEIDIPVTSKVPAPATTSTDAEIPSKKRQRTE